MVFIFRFFAWWVGTLGLVVPLANVIEMTLDGRCGSHRWGDQVGSTTFALSAFKVAIAGRSATFAWLESVGIHRQAHAAASFTPIETGFTEDSIESFLFSLAF